MTPSGDGPVVVVDWDARPLPEIPLPNDLATRPDPTSITGMRLNISELAPTNMESEARVKINELTGFGVYAPITVSFSELLDLDGIHERHRDDGDFSDDAFYIIDIEPDSPDYLQPIRVDIGHGRFPQDLDETDRYFPNDPRKESPALLFETYDEDINQNGVLDSGEDTDNDGQLDVPNVWPEGGDPREDLLTWYERQTNTLIVRPVVPLREETTYAVVLTDRLVDTNGSPVRSPWEYVHHLRQTEPLIHAMHALPRFGLSTENVAFAWTFTTGRITADLVDAREGLYGRGPWAWLGGRFPASVEEALQVHDNDDLEDPLRLPVNQLMAPISALGVLGSDGEVDALLDAYDSFAGDIVGGSFTTPYLLTDSDDNGQDDTDEYWKLDPVTGQMYVGPQRIVFTCVLPKNTGDKPSDVAIFSHGYGSSRFEMFAFAWGFNRMGHAVCAMDSPGHGLSIGQDDLAAVEAVFGNIGLTPLLEHLFDSRQRDIDNDGIPDSGADQWIADSFHTRDMVRQAALDTSQFIRALRSCGDTRMEADGESLLSCDWDDDGEPDIGGMDASFYMVGGSLGGINTAVTAAIEPLLTATAPIVGAGGLMDIGIRSPLKGVVEAVVGRLITPLILGTPTDDGSYVLSQHVISGRNQRNLPFASLPFTPAGGTIYVENLRNGELRTARIPADGLARVAIPADAADAFEKRELSGMPSSGHGGLEWTVEQNIGLGDELVVTVYDSEGQLVAEIDTFETAAVFEGITYVEGSRLVAASEGLGHLRGSPELRRLASFTGLIIEPGDPIAYAHAYLEEPFEGLGGQRNILIVPTPGDMVVAINAEIALARAAGMVNYEDIDPRYGMTVDQWLIDRQVVRGLEQFGPWRGADGQPVLFDADDLDNGTDDYGAPSDEPLRITVATDSGSAGMRLPYVSPTGSHGFATPDPGLSFDVNTFALHQIARFFDTKGSIISDDPCMADHSCSWLPEFQGGGR